MIPVLILQKFLSGRALRAGEARLFALLGLLLIAFGSSAFAAPEGKGSPSPMPPLNSSALVIDPGFAMENWRFQTQSELNRQSSLLGVNVKPFREATRIEIETPSPQNPDQIQLSHGVESELKAGSVLRFRFHARSETRNSLGIRFERGSKSESPFLRVEAKLSKEWTEYGFVFMLKETLGAGEGIARFLLGASEGKIELTGARLEDWGVSPTPRPPSILPTNFETWDAPKPGMSALALSADASKWEAFPAGSAVEKVEIADRAEFSQATRFRFSSGSARLSYALPGALQANSGLVFSFWARSSGENAIRVKFGRSAAGLETFLNAYLKLEKNWKRYQLPFRVTQTIPNEWAEMRLEASSSSGEVEIAGAQVEFLGAAVKELPKPVNFDYFGGQKADLSWRKEAQARIERLRKGNLRVRVTDENGLPLKNVKVSFEQKTHRFRFGVALPMEAVTDHPEREKYRTELLKRFNAVEIGSFWSLSPVQREGALQWAAQSKLYPLITGVFPSSFEALPEEARSLARSALVQTLEAGSAELFKSLQKRSGGIAFGEGAAALSKVAASFESGDWARVLKKAQSEAPGLQRAYSDWNLLHDSGGENASFQSKIEASIDALLEANAPLDFLLDRALMEPPLSPPDRLLARLRTLERFHLPVEIAGIAVRVEDERVQADYLGDYLTAVFSEPSMRGVYLSELKKRTGNGLSSALFNTDWTPRPLLRVFDELLAQWHTIVSASSNERGDVTMRGFLGDYEVVLEADGKRAVYPISIDEGGEAVKKATLKLK